MKGRVFALLRLLPPMRRLMSRPPLPGAVGRWLFFLLARRYTPLIASDEADGLRFLVRTTDAVAHLRFVYRGSEDRDVLKRTFELLGGLGRLLHAPNRVLLDVGANNGTTTIAALRFGYASHVVAIEAHPETANLLLQNLVLNGVADRATVINAAVTDEVGIVRLALSAEDSGDHRVHDGSQPRLARDTISVPATTLDTLMKNDQVTLGNVALVWIDVQGHEWRVLQGAQCLLQSDVPVVVEYWRQGLVAAGGLERFEHVARQHYSYFVDLRASTSLGNVRPTAQLPSLRSAYPDGSETDLLLL